MNTLNHIMSFMTMLFFAAAVVVAMSLKMVNVWKMIVLLRMGKLQREFAFQRSVGLPLTVGSMPSQATDETV